MCSLVVTCKRCLPTIKLFYSKQWAVAINNDDKCLLVKIVNTCYLQIYNASQVVRRIGAIRETNEPIKTNITNAAAHTMTISERRAFFSPFIRRYLICSMPVNLNGNRFSDASVLLRRLLCMLCCTISIQLNQYAVPSEDMYRPTQAKIWMCISIIRFSPNSHHCLHSYGSFFTQALSFFPQ